MYPDYVVGANDPALVAAVTHNLQSIKSEFCVKRFQVGVIRVSAGILCAGSKIHYLFHTDLDSQKNFR